MTGRTEIPWVGLAVIALLGAGIAFLSARAAADRPFFLEPAGGEYNYVAAARNLDSPRPIEPPLSTTAPAYPHLLAQFGDLTRGVAGARQWQWILLGALVPFMAGLAAARHFGSRAGLLAGGLVLLTGGFWVAAGTLMPHAWQALGALGLVALAPPVSRNHERPARLLGAAILMGAVLVLTRALGAAWAPALAIILTILFLARRQYVAGLTLAATFGLGAVLLSSARLDRMPGAVPILGGGGIDAVIGWHDGATGVDPRRGEPAPWRWTTAREIAIEAEAEAGSPLTVSELSQRSYGRAVSWLIAHPVAAVTLGLKKTWLVLGGADLAAPDSADLRARQLVPWARWLLPVSIVIMALGLAGLAAAAHLRHGGPSVDGVTVIKALLAATVLSALAGVFRTGDRFGLLVAMTVAAGYALASFRALPRGAMALGAVILLLGAGAWYAEGRRLESPAEDQYILGTVLDRLKRGAEASAAYDLALAADPRHVGAQLARAGRLASDGLMDGAISEAEDVVAANPRLTTVWNMLARLYQSQNRLTEASAAYQRVVELTPRDPEAWNNLGTIHAALGHYDPAVAALRQALAIDPNYRSAFVNLTELEKRGPEGLALATPSLQTPGAGGGGIADGVSQVMQRIQADDVAGAEALLAQLRETYGASPDIDLAAGTLALHTRRFAEAITLLERARSSSTLATAAWYNLGLCHAQMGNSAKAIAAWEEVLKLDPTNEPARAGIEQLRNAGGTP